MHHKNVSRCCSRVAGDPWAGSAFRPLEDWQSRCGNLSRVSSSTSSAPPPPREPHDLSPLHHLGCLHHSSLCRLASSTAHQMNRAVQFTLIWLQTQMETYKITALHVYVPETIIGLIKMQYVTRLNRWDIRFYSH